MSRVAGSVLIALLVFGVLLSCGESPTSQDTEDERSVESIRLLDDGTASYLEAFQGTHPGADCRPRRIMTLGPGFGALVEYECFWAPRRTS